MAKKALIVRGGWDGHEPVQVSEIFGGLLEAEGFEVEISDTLDSFKDEEKLLGLSLIVPIWTMGEISNEQLQPVLKAVAAGVGLAGCHGGMCDSFRNSVEWQFMTGSQWVAHPFNDGVDYVVNMVQSSSSPLIEGIKDFQVKSEQYYLHVDPCINVLATTTFPVSEGPHSANGVITVPVVYTKKWGEGRVFYNSLGHHADIFDIPEAKELMRRGFVWAAR
ncbi:MULTISPECIES: ThuA domain-containing protein [unclassified Paenibacillus]|uniref:ThuA domain-containing protein n=1 Tax=unclassified Paenibacillus TaxID=185978 RepID=UPI002405CA19|nr:MULTISPECIES: ThuA domain-containing protein [unclassified Paenibacillus]MDF9843465.1 type 1 glutamine amidotransferase [Paenibacillus sp. PastF-2]MDF9850053.1 type 1 glutamine amidotransferase [Paenibacillus sp. PastM-2]MDF9857743.1 type 1 glutamine amidotransferase [Paenibacillus sp. PastF-1]MDH6483010.1 type 1 glutamine amidotransferase [Paenibacillus sp. PastH-2]MDH6509187.1 type 1 glutamine amidotransferase [Paenibacillus sp. PastM-3]